MHLKNLTQQAKDNSYFRHVLATGGHTQVVIMSIPPGGEIGEEVHPDTDQILYLVEGSGQVILEGEPDDFSVGDLVLVTAGTRQPLRVPQASAPNHPRVPKIRGSRPCK